jgi:hypothetical protein
MPVHASYTNGFVRSVGKRQPSEYPSPRVSRYRDRVSCNETVQGFMREAAKKASAAIMASGALFTGFEVAVPE